MECKQKAFLPLSTIFRKIWTLQLKTDKALVHEKKVRGL